MDEEWITSVGIDLGTSTTKCIVSRLRLARKSGAFALPRFEIAERLLTYESAVFSTPLLNRNEIDVARVMQWLEQEYVKAGIRFTDIKSGAVIITGETANKHNAKQLVHYLADRAGDFVVATAGADLESLLSGKGSGAERRSEQSREVICNVDIGGGTANASFFRKGRMIETVTLHVGGRLIQLSPEGQIVYVSEAIRPWLREKGFHLMEGESAAYDYIRLIARQMSRTLLDFLQGLSMQGKLLAVGRVPEAMPPISEMMISGGIGGMLGSEPPQDMKEIAVYGDFGPLLAAALAEECARSSFRLVRSEHAVHATVIGAGMQSTEISGSTLHLTPGMLPMKNIPVVKLEDGDAEAAIRLGLQIYDPVNCPPFALFIPAMKPVRYDMIRRLSESIVQGYRRLVPGCDKLIVVCENDMAKALGQSLMLRSAGELHIVCIDQVKVDHGDYLDLGEPIRGTMIPVIVKTLVFSGS
ncbi:ethanolamine ammonia-lyase reactivating factor EutA [Paenibacillus mendelii]|uniref:Ethanolamine ammonia-lyase reactivating factor EutA n=1 Tax=Paenibacillus mendelii TaxID=206163 RepID=A0ABV6J426_9BACL|nr:ethanolamine ammonia-lyase reactivating factor EutA [Paenibacillus mendelii]MCQ6561848.1 ethanolamine ammonia-lyase reactivating factor EutA [Paenibacillus mendelii]